MSSMSISTGTDEPITSSRDLGESSTRSGFQAEYELPDRDTATSPPPDDEGSDDEDVAHDTQPSLDLISFLVTILSSGEYESTCEILKREVFSDVLTLSIMACVSTSLCYFANMLTTVWQRRDITPDRRNERPHQRNPS